MENLSLRLYNFLSNKLGSEDTVRTRRTYYLTHNYLSKTKTYSPFICGSKGEGLRMKGSDTDTIVLIKDIHIVEQPNKNVGSNKFVMRSSDTRPGFAQLELCSSFTYSDAWLKKIGHKFFLSSSKMMEQLLFVNKDYSACNITNLHGPCMSTSNETQDFTVGIKCISFIKQAHEWVGRKRHWPTAPMQKIIIDSGVWFVPIGYKLSPNEDIEWRAAFTVAEILLVFSFTHTQLMVYALLKIALKDLIENNCQFKELLCSYFLKTVVFWISEEIGVTEWTPHNFMNCFLECLKRLEYYVKYDSLPHYFITERNMLEHRVTLPEWMDLKTKIVQLYKKYPACLASSGFMSVFFLVPLYVNVSQNILPALSETDMVDCAKCSANLSSLNEVRFMLLDGQAILTYILTPMQVLVNSFELLKQKPDRFIFKCLFSTMCRGVGTRFTSDDVTGGGNKLHYQKLKEILPFVILGVRSDAVSGWNVLATFYYCIGRYSVSLKITDYVLCKIKEAKQEKLYYSEDKFTIDYLPRGCHTIDLSDIHITYSMEPNDFYRGSFLIPDEMKPEVEYKRYIQKPPIVYTFFIRFMCSLKLEQTQKCSQSLNNLKTLIETNNNIGTHVMKAECYTLLGIAYYLMGDLVEAENYHKKAFVSDRSRQFRYVKKLQKIRRQYEMGTKPLNNYSPTSIQDPWIILEEYLKF
ncbi:Hypothetical predicted protein [Mytilus galloprovincialis]|uniref:Mab-21-like HhH/H2TH-like domain-containing protein n=1 Tax=Mytilus galloprovincialis TaxID=29158 RepID=A0A8B6HLH3_MYTGA|nr:Hypothetical predicted protein [Mytilus galloprovincialis]